MSAAELLPERRTLAALREAVAESRREEYRRFVADLEVLRGVRDPREAS